MDIDDLYDRIAALPSPKRQVIPAEVYPCHARIDLARTFGLGYEYERGATDNPWRGHHTTIPCSLEATEIAAIEISHHKGSTIVEWLTWPTAPSETTAMLGQELLPDS